MKKLFVLMAIAALPCAACSDLSRGRTHHTPTPINDPVRRLEHFNMAQFRGTVERHLTRDEYQFIDTSGRILASVDGDVWRSTNVTERNGILTIV